MEAYNDHSSKKIVFRIKSQMTTKLRELKQRLVPFARRLQSLRIKDTRMVLMALILGCCEFHGATLRIWAEWKQFKRECEEATRIIGEIVVMIWDLRRHTNKLFAGNLLIKKPLHIMIHRHIHEYMLRIPKLRTNRTIIKLDHPQNNRQSIEVCEMNFHQNKIEKKTLKEIVGIRNFRDLFVIRIDRRRIEFSLWVRISLHYNEDIISEKTTRHWAISESYLGTICFCLWDFIENNDLVRMCDYVLIAADLGVQGRIMKPVFITALKGKLDEYKNIGFVKRVKRQIRSAEIDRSQPMHICEYSTQFWQFLVASEFDLLAESSGAWELSCYTGIN